MRRLLLPLPSVLALFLCSFGFAAEEGFESLFNGKDLSGWDGLTNHWSVQEGAITGLTTKDNPAKGNNFLISKDGRENLIVSDFELRFSYKFAGEWGNSGLQYRSKDKGNFVVHGYQADFEVGTNYSGILYEEGGRGILAERGQKTVIKEVDGKTKIDVVGAVGDSKEIQANIKKNGWNDYVVIAKGNHFQHFINGKQTIDVVDEQDSKAARSGILAFQIHQGPPMKIQFKNIRIKSLSRQAASGSDLEQMQGDWVALEFVTNGEKAPANDVAALKLKIKGNDFVVDTPQGQEQGTLKLNESTSPKSMDITTQSGDQVPGIYEIAADVFRVCYAINAASRPTQLKSIDGSNQVLITFKRKP